jgi:hypothetical protein
MTPETATLLILLCHAGATLYMAGLVWFVQRVHYPLLAGVGRQHFAAYERAHLSRITPIVAPAMLLEAGTALALVAVPPPHVMPWTTWLGLGLLGLIWLSTFLLQVPRHDELSAGFDAVSHQRLVASNWIRTSLWSLRGILVGAMVFYAAIPHAA